MDSKETVQAYFNALSQKQGWDKFVTDNIIFKSPMPRVSGKQQWIEMTQQFILGVTSASFDTASFNEFMAKMPQSNS